MPKLNLQISQQYTTTQIGNNFMYKYSLHKISNMIEFSYTFMFMRGFIYVN